MKSKLIKKKLVFPTEKKNQSVFLLAPSLFTASLTRLDKFNRDCSTVCSSCSGDKSKVITNEIAIRVRCAKKFISYFRFVSSGTSCATNNLNANVHNIIYIYTYLMLCTHTYTIYNVYYIEKILF